MKQCQIEKKLPPVEQHTWNALVTQCDLVTKIGKKQKVLRIPF